MSLVHFREELQRETVMEMGIHGCPGITQVSTNVVKGFSGYAVTSDSEDTAGN